MLSKKVGNLFIECDKRTQKGQWYKVVMRSNITHKITKTKLEQKHPRVETECQTLHVYRVKHTYTSVEMSVVIIAFGHPFLERLYLILNFPRSLPEHLT